jgi:hypothetical protein
VIEYCSDFLKFTIFGTVNQLDAGRSSEQEFRQKIAGFPEHVTIYAFADSLGRTFPKRI